jgi:hypothetical protein
MGCIQTETNKKNPVGVQRPLDSYHNTAITTSAQVGLHYRYMNPQPIQKKTCIATNKAIGHNITSIVRTENKTESNSMIKLAS